MTIPLRHGDWMFVPIDEVDATTWNAARDATAVPNAPSDGELPRLAEFTFGEGEATGHYHVAVAEKPGDMMWSKRGDEFIAKVLAPVHAKHPEHSLKGDLVIPPGTYRVVRRREKDWFAGSVRRVVD